MRIARLTLFGLVGLAVIAVSIALLMPASPPQQIVTPETVPAPPTARPLMCRRARRTSAG